MRIHPRQHAAPQVRGVTSFVFLLLAVGCGGDDTGAPCVDTVCVAGEAAICSGQEVRTCAADGKRFVYTSCSSQQRCQDGACVPKQCTTIGQATCASPTSVRRCADDGGGFTTTDCTSGETCRDGACVPTACTSSAPDRCTTHGHLKCVNGAWSQSTCPTTQVCSLDGTVARCLPTRCTPWAARCDGDTALLCDARGATEVATVCGDDEVCREGRCQARVCGDTTVADATDTTDTDVVSTTSQLLFTLNGTVVSFDQNAYAEFDAGARRLTIRASRNNDFLELYLQPSTATVDGSYSSEVFNPVRLIACYKGVGPTASSLDCPAGTTHQSSAYAINITRNDGTGGRIVGTFSLTVRDTNSDTLTLSGGQIDVRYR